jgi:hypothetical protein
VAVHWGTPSRPIQIHDFIRPQHSSSNGAGGGGTSLNSLEAPSSTNSSIPASPMIVGFDMYGNHIGATKRSRGMSLGFSMPFVDLESPTQ